LLFLEPLERPFLVGALVVVVLGVVVVVVVVVAKEPKKGIMKLPYVIRGGLLTKLAAVGCGSY
jgi:hypothetical protein